MKTNQEILAEVIASRQQIPNLNVSPTRDNMTILLFITQTLEDAERYMRALPPAEPVEHEGAADDA